MSAVLMISTSSGFLADDAEYITYDGRHCRGRAGIRVAFALQFAGRYGLLRLIPDTLVIDEASRQVVINWRCEQDLTSSISPVPMRWLQRSLVVVAGARPSGMAWTCSVFVRANGVGKYPYAQTSMSLLKKKS
jgi:hypothetical protein